MATTRVYRQFDFSGGVQTATSRLLRKPNEMVAAKNASFSTLLGAVARRNGYTQFAATIQSGKDGLGAFVHRYSTGTRVYGATNNSGDTSTILKYQSGGTWTDTGITSVAANTRMSATSFLDELYVVGATNSGTYMTPRNIDSSVSVSTTRNILGMPKAKWIVEFQGSLYAVNVDVGGTVYTDRAYKSSVATGVVTFVKTAQEAFGVMKVDTVRYLKNTYAIDIYDAGTNTKLYDLTITGVDKDANTISFTNPTVQTVSSVVAATDLFTTTTTPATGTPIQIAASVTIPPPLVAGTTYYAINISGTTFKVATTLANATAGTAIDITGTGSGTITVTNAVVVSDNDEIWMDGRKGLLTVLWNTDYPTTEDADYLRIPPGDDESTNITGVFKTANRLFFFTENSIRAWDGQNMVTISATVGCPQHEAIKEIDTWIIFPHYTGLFAYNYSSGQFKKISRSVQNYFQAIPPANWAGASAVAIDNVYKLSVGAPNALTIDGYQFIGNLRFTYDFDANIFSMDSFSRNPRFYYIWTDPATNVRRAFFQDDTGKVFTDDYGNLDDTETIPFEVESNQDNFGIDELKSYNKAFVYAKKAKGTLVQYSIEGARWETLGELVGTITKLDFKRNLEGRDIAYQFVSNTKGESPIIEGISTHFSVTEAQYAK